MKSKVVNISEVMNNPNMSLSAKDYVEKEEPKEQLTVFKNTKPLTDLMVVAQEIQKNCKDYVVPSNNLMFGVLDSREPHIVFSNNDLRKGGEVDTDLSINDYAFGQMCNKIGVPVKFMKKCLKDKNPQLVADCVHTYLHSQKDKPLFIRANGDKVRGVLSDKYSVLDTPDILEGLNEVLPNAKVKSYMMNEERLHIRLLGDMLDIEDEDLFWGLQVDSSDVGRNTLKVQFMIYKQVCTNGMVASKGNSELFVQRHIGIRKMDFINEFRSSLGNIPDLIVALTEDIVKSKDRISKNQMDKLIQKSVDTLKLDKKLDERINTLSKNYGPSSKWSVVNALTELAQDYTLERRLEIEKYAGMLLTA